MIIRCEWVPPGNELYEKYHDEEWGVPVRDDRMTFEFLILEGAQAGLSWLTILRKRENYRKAFDGFDIPTVAAYGESKIAELMGNPGIVRNRLKIEAAVKNARASMAMIEEFGSLSEPLWQFVGGAPKQNSWRNISEIPAKTRESDEMSRFLLSRGFKFVGSTICYAHMQAVGMVNDHIVSCFRHAELGGTDV